MRHASSRAWDGREASIPRGVDANPTTPRGASAVRQLPLVLAVTLVVCVLPAFAAPRLVTSDGIRAVIASVVLTLALSAGAAQLGAAAWSRRRHRADTLFADLLLGRWLSLQWRELRLRRMRARLLGQPPSPRPGSLAALARVGLLLEARDRSVYGHSRRVARYAQGIARALHLPADEIETIRQAALVHDIGKIYTPREILDKPGRLTDAEFDVIKRHPGDGADLLEASADPEIRAIVRHHHERLDGAGYPDGLAGDAIPIGARIIAVADTFDALASTRAYRPAATHRRALEVLRSEAGRQLDGDAVAAFLRVYSARRPVVLTATAGSLATRLGDRAASSVSNAGALLQAVPAIGAAIAVAGSAAPVAAATAHVTPAARHAVRAAMPMADPGARAQRSGQASRSGEHRGTRVGPRPARRSGGDSRPPRRVRDPAASVTTPGAPSAAANRDPAPRAPAPQPQPSAPQPSAPAPRATTPAAGTPAVTIAAVTTPSVTTPRLATAVVTVPAVSVPSVTVPSLTVPAITVPGVSLP
jgi:putative nucleotidyltransferase with HDIG domain